MNITFIVIVCILSCGVEAGSLIDEQFCKKPTENKDYECAKRTFTVHQTNEHYYGSGRLQISKSEYSVFVSRPYYTIEPQKDGNIPYISEIVDGVEILKYELKMVSFSITRFNTGRGITAKALFEKEKCDITVYIPVSPTGSQSEKINERLEEYLQTTDFSTESDTKHDLKWIEDFLKAWANPVVFSELNGDHWTQDYSASPKWLSVTEKAIKKMFVKTGLGEASN